MIISLAALVTGLNPPSSSGLCCILSLSFYLHKWEAEGGGGDSKKKCFRIHITVLPHSPSPTLTPLPQTQSSRGQCSPTRLFFSASQSRGPHAHCACPLGAPSCAPELIGGGDGEEGQRTGRRGSQPEPCFLCGLHPAPWWGCRYLRVLRPQLRRTKTERITGKTSCHFLWRS